MDQPTLKRVIEDQLERSTQMLFAKNGGYNVAEDKLRNFKVAGTLQNEGPRQALAGMMAKHTVSVYDMCKAPDIHTDLDVWNEKITDSINYLLLLRAIVEEEVVETASGNVNAPDKKYFSEHSDAELEVPRENLTVIADIVPTSL